MRGKEVGNEGIGGHFFEPKIEALAEGIRICIENKLIEPALILTYSAIDIVAWLGSPEEWISKKVFLAWTEKYLLKAKPLSCTAVEIYAARCGLLHTFSAESKLSKQGSARHIYYAWGTAEVAILQRSIDLVGKSDRHVAIHVGDLFEGWRLGVKYFLNDLKNDQEKRSLVYGKAGKFFTNMKPVVLRSAVDVLDKKRG